MRGDRRKNSSEDVSKKPSEEIPRARLLGSGRDSLSACCELLSCPFPELELEEFRALGIEFVSSKRDRHL